MRHQWMLADDGSVDKWILDYQDDAGTYHNGPMCQVCDEAFCVYCTPGWADLECPGDDPDAPWCVPL